MKESVYAVSVFSHLSQHSSFLTEVYCAVWRTEGGCCYLDEFKSTKASGCATALQATMNCVTDTLDF